MEIKDLKKSSIQLREELESMKFSKKKEVQKAVLNSNDEIIQLKKSSQILRKELEKIIKTYEEKIKEIK